MKGKQEITVYNLILIIMLAVCVAIGGLVIAVVKNTAEIDSSATRGEKISNSYSTTEETSNTWDISENGDGSVIATFADDGTLNISGTGNMKNWNSGALVGWNEIKDEIKTVIITSGVTNIGRHAFYKCSNLTKIEIPETVTSIGSYAFYYCNSLTEIEIPSGVTIIDSYVFYKCSSLTKIKLPSTVTSIGTYTFYYCSSLTEIEIPNGVTTISSYLFYGCNSLAEIEIPSSVTNIDKYAFGNCSSLIEVKIPSGVTNIGDSAFRDCSSLTKIEVDENNTKYMDYDGILYTKDETEIIKYPEGKTDIEYTIIGKVTTIGSYAFYKCSFLTKIKLPSSITNIGAYAFGNCSSLTEIEIPDGVTSIENSTFFFCNSLEKIEIPSSVTNIGDMAFYYCKKLTEIKIPSSVTNIGERAFYYCNSLTKIEILSGETSIGDSAFSYCTNLRDVEIPSSIVANMGNCVFENSVITNLVEQGAKDIELPNILKISQNENNEFTLTNCTINDSNLTIADGVLYAKVVVASGKMEGLTYALYYNTWDVSESDDGSVIAILSNDGDLTISGTGNMKSRIERESTWRLVSNLIKTVKIESGIRNIGTSAFYRCENLTSIEISDSVTSIGKEAFYSCYRLASVEISNSLTIIGPSAFEWCESITSIEIPNSVTSIGEWAFYGCDSLKNIEVDENNTNYMDCDGVLYTKDGTKIIKYPGAKEETQYIIRDGVEVIGNGAFSGSINLETVEIPTGVISIEEDAFSDCYNLKNVDIPSGVISIGDYAFYYCENLTRILILNNVTGIGTSVFDGCDNLIIICKRGTTAEAYAKEKNINYATILDGINPKTTVGQLKQNLDSEYEILDLNDNVLTDEAVIVTGCKVKMSNGENYIIIVVGDSNGDGQADIQDILAINKHRLNKASLKGEYLLAADVNEDGQADIKDILQINKYRLEKIEEL